MNVNEVIAHLTGLHPNDDVNKGQSTNDAFPTAIHIATVIQSERYLIPAIHSLRSVLGELSKKYESLVKIGRTHLQDATPLTLGQEISAWKAMLDSSLTRIDFALEEVRALAIGGTAVGTGIGTVPRFAELATYFITNKTGTAFRSAENKFHALSSRDALTAYHSVLKVLATDLYKIASDIRLLASGPRAGIGELSIPANEPGSSIMPGKVNPTQCEMMTMVCARVIGNDTVMGFANSQGHLQLNVYMPLIAHTMVESIGLLSDAINSFNSNCVIGLKPNEEKIAENLERSLMLVTALSPKIGYDRAAEIAKYAHENGLSLREAAVGRGIITEGEFDELVDPAKMVSVE
jgi:fumarate hydratase class II